MTGSWAAQFRWRRGSTRRSAISVVALKHGSTKAKRVANPFGRLTTGSSGGQPDMRDADGNFSHYRRASANLSRWSLPAAGPALINLPSFSRAGALMDHRHQRPHHRRWISVLVDVASVHQAHRALVQQFP